MTEPTQEKRQHNVLSRLQDAQLANYMAGYTESGLHDEAFAAKATEALGFTVSEHNIRGWRYELKLEANKKPRSDIGVTRKGSREEVLQRLEKLEQGIATILEGFEVLSSEVRKVREHANGQAKRMDDIENHVATLQKYIAVLQATLDDETMRKLGAFRSHRK